jgi:hypothetical protein
LTKDDIKKVIARV